MNNENFGISESGSQMVLMIKPGKDKYTTEIKTDNLSFSVNTMDLIISLLKQANHQGLRLVLYEMTDKPLIHSSFENH